MKKKYFLGIVVLSAWSVAAQTTLTLDLCRANALKHNKTLLIAAKNIQAARELKKAAFTQFLPNFSANGTYTWNEKNLSLLAADGLLPVGTKMADGSFGFTADQISNKWTMVNGSPVPLDGAGTPFNPKTNPEKIQWKGYSLLPHEAMEFDIKNVFAGNVGFVQPLFLGGKIVELYKMSTYSVELAEAQKLNKEQELLVEVDEAYCRILSLEHKIALAKEYRTLVGQLEKNVETMIEEGVATKADALKVRVKLNEADVALTRAENGISLSRMALNQLCGMPLDDIYTLEETDLKKQENMPTLLPLEQAINNRPEMTALNQLHNIAKSNQKIMVSRFLPTLALSGNYLLSNPSMYNGYENKIGGMFSVGLVAHVPLFHFGDKIHTLNVAKSQFKMAELQIDEAKEKMELQIKQSSYKVAESLQKLTTTKRNVEQAAENMKYASDGFNEGVITSTDLLSAQTAWLSAKSENIDASIEIRLCNLYLQKSQGMLGKK